MIFFDIFNRNMDGYYSLIKQEINNFVISYLFLVRIRKNLTLINVTVGYFDIFNGTVSRDLHFFLINATIAIISV